tara:strand:+ start:64 stop:1737 length:1674 start_codon:yes stop_codon:yes gene_type:complete
MSQKSKVLALKYRPSEFKDLIGQKVIAETIYNSIKSNKIPNAYLFTGIRGVGKTTIARIIAKALNCKNGLENLCKDNFCENCEAISQSNHIDVFELDAASRSSVENTKELIEFSRYPPTSSNYKIYILDECHMLSRQAWNSLLKTLEEPPDYLRFIFATTEIKKVPVTIVSRCQRFDLSRVKSEELFKFIKDVKEKEKGQISDEALKLIVKISEGSVRDALSLLDRAMLANLKDVELDLKSAQKIFGCFDKIFLIKLFKNLFDGNEKEVIKIYRSIYDQGVEPKNFLNDFLEVLYYFKNIKSLNLKNNNFEINDHEFKEIEKISTEINPKVLLIFWQFTIKTLDELEIVSNQNLSIEMFLIRLMYLQSISKDNNIETNKLYEEASKSDIDNSISQKVIQNSDNLEIKKKTISQIKNIFQEDEIKPIKKIEDNKGKIEINSFEELINICNKKKEIHLKYELETNVNLVSFSFQKIEISFNENLNKNFVKDLSAKLYEWTNLRWIIAFSKKKGKETKKQTDINSKSKILEEAKMGEKYNKIIDVFSDAELVDVEITKNN